jgi:methionyl-tRNA formyltransferase
LLKKENGRIDWQRPAKEIFNRIRGFAPWPGASTTFRGQACQIWGEPLDADKSPQFSPEQTPQQPQGQKVGEILRAANTAGAVEVPPNWLVICGHTTLLRLTAVKLEGRKQISSAEFAHGARLTSGDHFV